MKIFQVISLKELTYDSLVNVIWRWKPFGLDMLTSTRSMNKYIQRLPVGFLKELYVRFLRSARYDYQHYVQAWHVALFLHYGQTELKLWFENKSFDLQFLLHACGNKLLLLQELELPMRSSLPATLCRTMCDKLPTLTNLDLHGVGIGDDAMPFLATLSLKTLNVEGTDVLDDGLMQLCNPKAKARWSLLDLRIGERCSVKTCYRLLRAITQLEYLSYNNCLLLTSLTREMMNKKLNLRRLECKGAPKRMAQALKIALVVCGCVNNICINAREFTSEILDVLTKFNYLYTLTLSNHLKVDEFDDLSVYFQNFVLCSLRNLSIDHVEVNWFLSGHFLNLLLMCPQLEALSVSYSTGFDDQIACNMAQLLINSKLQHIKLNCCNTIGPKAICSMLNIPSLFQLFIAMAIPAKRAAEFNIARLKRLANIKNVNLKLSIYCY